MGMRAISHGDETAKAAGTVPVAFGFTSGCKYAQPAQAGISFSYGAGASQDAGREFVCVYVPDI